MGTQSIRTGNPNEYNGFYFVTYHFGKFMHLDRTKGGYRHYIHYLHTGNVKIVTEMGSLEAKAGELFYIPMGLSYDSYWSDAEDAIVSSCGFQLFPEARSTAFKLQKLPRKFITRFLDIPLQIQPDSAALGKFYTLLSEIAAVMEFDSTPPGPPLLEKIKIYMWKYPNRHIEDVAQHCGMSKASLYNKTKALTGKTPHQLKLEIQIEKAKNALINTDSSIHLISEEASFCTPTHFREVFKQHTGMTPRQFRAKARGVKK